MPDLLHVLDFVSVKVHHVNVIGFESLPCRWAGAPLTCMRSHKDRIRGNVLTFFVGSKRFQVISSVWNKGEQILHPFGVPFKRTNFDERLGLRRERIDDIFFLILTYSELRLQRIFFWFRGILRLQFI